MKAQGFSVITDQLEQQRLMTTEHLVGHFGTLAMIESLKRQLKWWPRMIETANSVTKACIPCCALNPLKSRFKHTLSVESDQPMKHIQIDCITDLPPTAEGYTTILTTVCIFSGFAILTPMKTANAHDVAIALWDIFSIFGPPQILQSDNGKEFVNSTIQRLISILGFDNRVSEDFNPRVIDVRHSAPYNSRGQGKVERTNGAVQQVLRKLCDDFSEWSQFLPAAQFSLNRKISSVTGYSPFFLVFGRDPSLFANSSNSTPISDQDAGLKQWIEAQNDISKILHPSVAESSAFSKQAAKDAEDAKRRYQKLAILPRGTVVWIKDVNRLNKHDSKCVGPYQVDSITPSGTYRLSGLEGIALQRDVPPDHISVKNEPNSVAESIPDEGVFIVSKILDRRGTLGNYEYLIKWKGFEEPTWVLRTDIHDKKIIEEYNKALSELMNPLFSLPKKQKGVKPTK
jgi:transposase InsO family protein